jgi:hypothetical protein
MTKETLRRKEKDIAVFIIIRCDFDTDSIVK